MLPDALAHHDNIQWRCLKTRLEFSCSVESRTRAESLTADLPARCLVLLTVSHCKWLQKTLPHCSKKSHRTLSKFLAHSKLVLQWKVKRLMYLYSYSKSQLFSSSFIKMVSGFGREEWGLGCRWVTEKKTEDWNSKFLPLLLSNN